MPVGRGVPGCGEPAAREVAAATAELILREDIAATLAADGEAVDGVAVDERWAAEVAMTLGWARAALTGDPLRPAARGVDDDGHERDNGRER